MDQVVSVWTTNITELMSRRGGSRGCPGCPDTRPLIRCPIPNPLDAFGVSVSAPLVPLSDGLDTRPCKILDPTLNVRPRCVSSGVLTIATSSAVGVRIIAVCVFVCLCNSPHHLVFLGRLSSDPIPLPTKIIYLHVSEQIDVYYTVDNVAVYTFSAKNKRKVKLIIQHK